MKNKLFALIALLILLTVTATTYAQSASTEDDGSGLPVPLPVLAIIAVVAAVVVRTIFRTGSRGPIADFDEDDYYDEPPRRDKGRRGGRRKGVHIDDDAEAYLIERDQMWDEDGYGGEEDVGF